jgi:phage FluMu protein Com
MNENNILSNIPQTLKELSRWILWRLERRDGAETKVPYRTDGLRASPTNPNDWTDFATAVNAFDPARYNGLGFVLTKEDNIVCIDLDECIGEDGKICDEANNIVRIMNSWTEISQSGKGLHIFISGSKPMDKSKFKPREFKAIEIYDNARYIAMTGNHFQDTPLEIMERQWALNTICDFYFPKSESIPTQSFKPQQESLSDDEIIALCRKAQNAPKFVALYDNGDTSLYDGDESRADEALACLLAFYTKDAAQLERLMNASALARREKWRQRQDYRRMTIQKALSLSREHYAPKPKSSMNLDSHSLTSPKVKLDVVCPECKSFTLYYIMQEGMYFLRCESCDFNKLVIEFRDNLDEGKMEFKCPKCGLWQYNEPTPCESCGFTADKILLRHESTLRDEVAVIDQPIQRYPLQKLNGNPSELDVDESEPDAIEKIVPEKVFEFDDGLIQRGTVFEELFRHYSRNEIPPQFAFAGTIATISAVIGNRVKIKFNDQLLKCNDYYVLLSESGTGKTTILSSVFDLLERLEGKIIHDSSVNIFLYPTEPTERAIIDVMREATSAEKEKGIKHTPQPSGLFVCDEITSLFAEMTQKHSAKLDSLILKLWDGKARIPATSKRLDGKFRVPESALTILGSSTPSNFRSKMPKTAFSDGMLARMNFILEHDDTKPLKTIGKHIIQSNPFDDEGIGGFVIQSDAFDDESSALIKTLLSLYQFVEQTKKFVATTDAFYAEEKNAARWTKEKKEYTENEAIKVYYNRIVPRMWKYSIILSACRALARNEDKITIDAEIVQHAAKIADFFKAQFIYFVQKSNAKDEKGLDTIGKIKVKVIELLSGKYAKKGATFRDLLRFTNASKANLTTALNELCEASSVLTIKENYKGREIVRYIFPKHSQTDTSKLSYNG